MCVSEPFPSLLIARSALLVEIILLRSIPRSSSLPNPALCTHGIVSSHDIATNVKAHFLVLCLGTSLLRDAFSAGYGSISMLFVLISADLLDALDVVNK